jgi:hypothetical protein
MANAAERRDERLLPFERSSKKKSTRKRNRKPVADIDA